MKHIENLKNSIGDNMKGIIALTGSNFDNIKTFNSNNELTSPPKLKINLQRTPTKFNQSIYIYNYFYLFYILYLYYLYLVSLFNTSI